MKKKILLISWLVLTVGFVNVARAESLVQTESTVDSTVQNDIEGTDSSDKEKNPEELTSESVTDSDVNKENSTDVDGNKEKNNVLPEFLYGNWTGKADGKEISLTIEANKYIQDDVEYNVLDYTVQDNVYTIIWDENAYIEKYGKPDFWNPQPLIITYDQTNDTINTEIVTYSKQKIEKKYEKYVENQDIPSVIQGTWVAMLDGKEQTWKITARDFNVNGVLNYKITSYGINGNEYSLFWSMEDYIANYGKPSFSNEDPYVFVYNEKDDTLTSDGIIFKRQSVAESSSSESTSTKEKSTKESEKQEKKLPQTNEQLSYGLMIIGGISVITGGAILLKK